MGLKMCEITLDNPWNTYYAGQTVNGQVNFTFDSPKKVRGTCTKFIIIEEQKKTDNFNGSCM